MNNAFTREQDSYAAEQPQRFSEQETHPAMNRVVFLLALSALINYIDRSNLSIAAPLIKDELGISSWQLGKLLSAFFWTYALLQVPAGWLVDRFDVKWVFALGFFVWSAATAVTGVLHGFAALLAIRVILGVGESVAIPAYSKIVGGQVNQKRRGYANSVVMAGLALGPALGMLVGGNVVGRFGWRPFFVALGLLGMLWLAPWWAWMPARTAASEERPGQKETGVLDVLRQRSAWGCFLCLFCFNYSLYFLVTWLPFYLIRGRNLSMTRMARVGGLVFLVSAASSILFGKLSDRWIAAGSSPTAVRKTLMVTGQAGMGVFLIASAVAPDSLVVWTLALVGLFNGVASSNFWAISQTLAGPRVVGRWTGLQNFVGNFAGAVSPALTGFLLDKTGQFYWPFFLVAAIAWIGALSWIFIVGRVEEVQWEKYSHAKPARGACPAPQPPPP